MTCHTCNRPIQEGPGIDVGHGLVVCQDCADNDPATKQAIQEAEAEGDPSPRGS